VERAAVSERDLCCFQLFGCLHDMVDRINEAGNVRINVILKRIRVTIVAVEKQ
jgi:hypothetical protein